VLRLSLAIKKKKSVTNYRLGTENKITQILQIINYTKIAIIVHFAKPKTLNRGRNLKIRSHAKRLSERGEPHG